MILLTSPQIFGKKYICSAPKNKTQCDATDTTNHIFRMIQATTQQQKMQAIIHDLTDKCWETCVDKPGYKMDSKTRYCLENCVQRFIDANIIATKNLEKKSTDILNRHDRFSID